MNPRKNENFIILLVSIACIGLTVESIMMGWEFWVPPLIIIGTIGLWVMNLSGKPEFEIRQILYMVYAMLTVLFHGVHETSLFDCSIVMVLVMIAFSFFGKTYMMNAFAFEYVCIMVLQLVSAGMKKSVEFDGLNISRVILHVIIVTFIYFCCSRSIRDKAEADEIGRTKDELIEKHESDMEDFLSNISHELRTPVNVVSGMSDLLIKKNAGKEAYSIKDAGIRLAGQIEDIQDYTECQRKRLLIEEEDYMSTSLINDVVTAFRTIDNGNKLELVVDLDPAVPTKMKGDIKKLHKIFRHLLENAVKFTKRGGIYVKMYAERTDYGVNLGIEMTDTGIGIDRKGLEAISRGMYQADKKRNRSNGGIGLGLYIVYGFVHHMGGVVKIESDRKIGTTVRVTIPQKVLDYSPCLSLEDNKKGGVLFHVRSDKYKVPQVRDFYRSMASNLAYGLRLSLYSAENIRDIDRTMEKMEISHIFMGQEEYEENPAYFDELSRGDIVVAVSANAGFKPTPGSGIMVMPKPLYGYPVVKILKEGKDAKNIEYSDNTIKPEFDGIRALVVDDEPMNLVVASSIFSDYKMSIETADSGSRSIRKYMENDYDIIFMDHMMPGMDGVEAMKKIREIARETGRKAIVVALTANVVSGAREMFIKEGFDGFIAKPINTGDFERVMLQVLPDTKTYKGGTKA